MFEGIRKQVGGAISRFPLQRKPKEQALSIQDLFRWAFTAGSAPKTTQVSWNTYYQAMDNPTVSACSLAIVTEILGANFDIKRDDDTQPSEPIINYLSDLFKRPDGDEQDETFTSFTWKTWSCLLGTGDVFIEVVQDSVLQKLPIGFYYIQPHRMQYFYDTDQWGLIGTNVRFEPDQLIHVRIPNPFDDLWGKSPIDKIANSVALDILAWRFNTKFFEKGGIHPRGVLSYNTDKYTPTEFNAEIERVREQAQTNPQGNLMLYGGEYQNMASSNKDMEFSSLMDKIRDRILGVYGVPPHKVSIIESGNIGGGTGEDQDINFKKKLQGWMNLFEDGYNQILGSAGFDENFHYGEMDFQDKLKRAQIEDIRLKNGSTSINEVRHGYGEDDVDWGDYPFSLQTGVVMPGVNPQAPPVQSQQPTARQIRLNQLKAEMEKAGWMKRYMEESKFVAKPKS
jgi:HK97 family phage portal protein